MAQTLLTISILVSGRAETTERCLESLRPIMDSISTELILVDTGCGDILKHKLEKYATKIIPFTWCNDFSKARNIGLKEATGQWFLYLDDDEWFADTEDLIAFFQSGDYQRFASASYIQRNYLDMEGSQYTDTRVGRMARITPELHFRSRIHEYLTPARMEHKNLTSVVEHYGYVYATEEDKLAHFKRNQTLLEEMIKEEPECLRWRLQLLQEYRSIDDYDMMEACGKAGVAMINQSMTSKDKEACVYIGSFYAARILAADGKNDYDRVYKLCKESMTDERNTRLCKTFLNEMLAKACFYKGLRESDSQKAEQQYGESELYAQEYLKEKEYFELHPDEFYDQQVAPFVGECLDIVKQKEIYSIRICNGLKMNSTNNLNLYIASLRWDEKHVYVFEEIADILIEAMNHFGSLHKDEEISKQTDFDTYAQTLTIINRQYALWDYFCELISKYQCEGLDMNGIIRLIGVVLPNEVEQENNSDEMEQLVIQIKQQIRLLITNGMKDQARVAIEQIKRLMPTDMELQELEKLCD